DRAERQQRPRAPERVADRLVLGNRPLEQYLRLVDVPLRSRDEAAAANSVREHPDARYSRRVRLPSVEERNGVFDAPELEQELDVISGPPPHARLAPAELCGALVRLAEPLEGDRRLPLSEGNEPQDRDVLRRVEPELLVRQRERPLRVL